MKVRLALIIGCVGILFSSYAFSNCGSCGDGWGGCEGSGGGCNAQPSACCEYEAPCQCTDPNYRYNGCISKCEYCEAFGNVGAR